MPFWEYENRDQYNQRQADAFVDQFSRPSRRSVVDVGIPAPPPVDLPMLPAGGGYVPPPAPSWDLSGGMGAIPSTYVPQPMFQMPTLSPMEQAQLDQFQGYPSPEGIQEYWGRYQAFPQPLRPLAAFGEALFTPGLIGFEQVAKPARALLRVGSEMENAGLSEAALQQMTPQQAQAAMSLVPEPYRLQSLQPNGNPLALQQELRGVWEEMPSAWEFKPGGINIPFVSDMLSEKTLTTMPLDPFMLAGLFGPGLAAQGGPVGQALGGAMQAYAGIAGAPFEMAMEPVKWVARKGVQGVKGLLRTPMGQRLAEETGAASVEPVASGLERAGMLPKEGDIPAWRLDADQFQARAGVPQPHIMEISPTQYARMSKRQLAQYEARRRLEWQASADIKTAWHDQVIDAFRRGEFTEATPGVSQDALAAVSRYLRDTAAETRQAAIAAATQANEFASAADVQVGDRVWGTIEHRYGTVVKTNKASVVVDWDTPLYGDTRRSTVKVGPRALSRLSPDDLVARVDADPSATWYVDRSLGEEIVLPKPSAPPSAPAAEAPAALTPDEQLRQQGAAAFRQMDARHRGMQPAAAPVAAEPAARPVAAERVRVPTMQGYLEGEITRDMGGGNVEVRFDNGEVRTIARRNLTVVPVEPPGNASEMGIPVPGDKGVVLEPGVTMGRGSEVPPEAPGGVVPSAQRYREIQQQIRTLQGRYRRMSTDNPIRLDIADRIRELEAEAKLHEGAAGAEQSARITGPRMRTPQGTFEQQGLFTAQEAPLEFPQGPKQGGVVRAEDLWVPQYADEASRAAAERAQMEAAGQVPMFEAKPEVAAAAPEPVPAARPEPVGKVTQAVGPDPNKGYEFRYRLRNLDELTPSHTDSMAPNPAFPRELQPRLRDRAASELQVDKIARELNASALLDDVHQLDRGPMIVGTDGIVESGNGRVLALRRARARYPEQFAAYEEALRARLPEYGIDPAAAEGMSNPVLVRERITAVDRPAFAAEANQTAVLSMSPVELALQDVGRLTDEAVAALQVGADQSIDQALKAASNRDIIRQFIGNLPANERAALLDAQGALNAQGLQRIKAALFAKTYPGDAGQRLATAFLESLDPGIKRIEQGMFASLPQMARAESLIRAGHRSSELSIADDVARAVDVLARLREQGIPVRDYLAQGSLFERELGPFQETLLQYLDDISTSPRKVREFMAGYAQGVTDAPPLGQSAMFGVTGPTKGEILERVAKVQGAEEALAPAVKATTEQSAPKPTGQAEAATPVSESPQLAGRSVEAPAPATSAPGDAIDQQLAEPDIGTASTPTQTKVSQGGVIQPTLPGSAPGLTQRERDIADYARTQMDLAAKRIAGASPQELAPLEQRVAELERTYPELAHAPTAQPQTAPPAQAVPPAQAAPESAGATTAATPPPGQPPTQPPSATAAGGDDLERLTDALRRPEEPLGQRINRTVAKMLTDFYDRVYPLKQVQEQTGIPTYDLARIVPGSQARGESFIIERVQPVLKSVEGDLGSLEKLMVARRMQDLQAINPAIKLPGGVQDPAAAIASLQSKLGAERFAALERAMTELYRLNDELILRPWLDEGIISQEVYDAIRTRHPHYIPFFRQDFAIEDALVTAPGRQVASVHDQVLKAISEEGSTKRLDRPLARWQAQIIKAQTVIARNRAARAMVEGLQAYGDAIGTPLVEVGAKGRMPGSGMVYWRQAGELMSARVPETYATVAKGLEAEAANTLSRVLMAAAAPLRMGAVQANPAFLVVNPIRDLISAYYREGLVPWAREYLEGWIAAITRNANWHEAARAGVFGHGVMDIGRSTGELTTERLGAITVKNIGEAITVIPRLIMKGNEVAEQATRIAVFRKLRAKGLSELESVIGSLDATVDFSKSGNVIKLINQAIPFLNAGIQGAANTVRLMRDKPTEALVRAAPLGLASILFRLWNERYDTAGDIPEYERANYWVLQIGQGQQKPDPKYPNQPGKMYPIYIKIPKGPLGAFLTAPVETALSVAFSQDDRSVVEHVLEGARTAALAMSPVEPTVTAVLPPLVGVGVQMQANRDIYRNREIVPQGEQGRPAAQQYGSETSRAAIALGEKFNVSPRVIEFAIKDYVGGAGSSALWLLDLGLQALGYNPGVPGQAKERELTAVEQASKNPIVGRFIGTKANEGERRIYERIDQEMETTRQQAYRNPEVKRFGLGLNAPTDSVTINGETRQLTPEQRLTILRTSTPLVEQAWRDLINRPYYKAADDVAKRQMLENVRAKIVQAAREPIVAGMLGQRAPAAWNANTVKLYLDAYGQKLEYDRIPQFLKLTPQQAEIANRGAARISALTKAGLPAAAAKARLAREDPEALKLALMAAKLRNPARKQYWQTHPLLNTFFGQLSLEDLQTLPKVVGGR